MWVSRREWGRRGRKERNKEILWGRGAIENSGKAGVGGEGEKGWVGVGGQKDKLKSWIKVPNELGSNVREALLTSIQKKTNINKRSGPCQHYESTSTVLRSERPFWRPIYNKMSLYDNDHYY